MLTDGEQQRHDPTGRHCSRPWDTRSLASVGSINGIGLVVLVVRRCLTKLCVVAADSQSGCRSDTATVAASVWVTHTYHIT